MLNRRALLSALPALAFAQNRKFVRSYFYIKPESKLILVDFAFGSDKRGWALGGVLNDRRVKGAMLATADGGNSWSQTELSFVPNSLFVLDDSFLWAVSDRGEIWSSAEGGKDWKKVGRKENALRVHFLDAQHGFLVGRKKTFMRTEDGGKNWAHVPEAAQVLGSADEFVYHRVDFWNGKIGMVFGGTEDQDARPRRRGDADLPAWMSPETGSFRNEPHIMVHLETRDGGKTWSKQELSGFGRIHRTVIGSDAKGLSLIKFNKSFTYGGELYSFSVAGNQKGSLALRTKELELQDVLYIPGDGVYLASTEKQVLPVPTKVRIRYSKDLGTWVDLPVDYRAVAQSVILTATPTGKVFAALDQGTILALR